MQQSLSINTPKQQPQAVNPDDKAIHSKPKEQKKSSTPDGGAEQDTVSVQTTTAKLTGKAGSEKGQQIAVTEESIKAPIHKRKSQDEHESLLKRNKTTDQLEKGSSMQTNEAKANTSGLKELAQQPKETPKEPVNVITIEDTKDEDEILIVEEERRVVERKQEVVQEERQQVPHVESEDENEKEEEEEEEVSRVMIRDMEDKQIDDAEKEVESEGDEVVNKEEQEKEEKREQEVKVQQEVIKLSNLIEPVKKNADMKETTVNLRNSIDESLSSIDTKSMRSDDVFSEGEVEAAPSSSSATSAPKPSLRERIDRFRAIFSPAPRPASSIPRLSPPKATQSPPRPLVSNVSKAPPSQLLLPTRPASPPKSPAKSPAKATFKQTTVASVTKSKPAASAPTPNPVEAPVFKVAPAPISVKAAAAPSVKAAPPPSVKVVAPVQVKLTSQSKTVKVTPSQLAPPIATANPFQKAQQQQQQAALATTSTLRAKQQPPPPPPSTAHIELEEPDSAYSDSDDEETVRRRQQHKPWETKEGLAKALEEQASVDADMIFGIPHGTVPIDEILPAETDYARAKRARPRSSSATWSRDGLKQIEIDRYNERMGIKGPGVLLPITVQDVGSGTPSRANRLSAIAQSAITQGQVSRKASQSATRGSISPVRPVPGVVRPGATSSQGKYPLLTAGTPKPKGSNNSLNTAYQKSKTTATKTAGSNSQSSKQGSTKTATKNPFQTGASSTLQPGRLANSGSKVSATTAESRKKS